MGLLRKPGATGGRVAIYSLHHSTIGKSTQATRYGAVAHLRYITRKAALTHSDSARMPQDAGAAATFLRAGEDRDRANARVIDKLMLALPRELTDTQRHALVRAFAEAVTQGRAAWFAAFHEGGKDVQNPHCHLIIRDRDVETGRRVAQLSEKGSTQRLRELWETHANAALALAQRPERIDRRSLKAQGITRRPTIHEGVRGRRMALAGRLGPSRARNRRNAALARTPQRSVRYPEIDRGGSRMAYNALIKAQEAAWWTELDAARREEEFQALKAIHRPSAEAGTDLADDWLEKRKRRLKPKPSFGL
jgi:hypothetical protein